MDVMQTNNTSGVLFQKQRACVARVVKKFGGGDADLLKKASLCEKGGEFGAKYIGSDRVILAPAGSFHTNSSKECCGLCDAIKGAMDPFMYDGFV